MRIVDRASYPATATVRVVTPDEILAELDAVHGVDSVLRVEDVGRKGVTG